MISRRPLDFSLCAAVLVALGACNPNETGGGGGSTSSSGSASSSSASSSGSASSSSGSGGSGGATASSSNASSASASSSSSSGAGGGGAGSVSVAWTKAIPGTGNVSLFVDGISAETPNRLFIGGEFTAGSLTYAGTTITNFPPHDAAFVLAMDGAGTPVSNAVYGDMSYNYSPRLLATDAAGNLFAAGDGNGTNGNVFMPAQKYGVSPWLKKPGGVNSTGNPIAFAIAADASGNLLLGVSPPQPQGANFGGGVQTSPVLLTLDGATGGFVSNKPWPGGSMHRDGAGNLFFFKSGAAVSIQKDDANLAPIWTKTFTGAMSGSMALGPTGEIGIAGTFQGGIDLGCGLLFSAGNVSSLVVARLDANGSCLYSKRFDPAGYGLAGQPLGLTAAGEIVVVGTMTSGFDFGGGMVAPGTFVLKLNAAGGYVSSTSIAATQLFTAVDAEGGVYLVGGDFDVGTGAILGNVKGIAVAKLVP